MTRACISNLRTPSATFLPSALLLASISVEPTPIPCDVAADSSPSVEKKSSAEDAPSYNFDDFDDDDFDQDLDYGGYEDFGRSEADVLRDIAKTACILPTLKQIAAAGDGAAVDFHVQLRTAASNAADAGEITEELRAAVREWAKVTIPRYLVNSIDDAVNNYKEEIVDRVNNHYATEAVANQERELMESLGHLKNPKPICDFLQSVDETFANCTVEAVNAAKNSSDWLMKLFSQMQGGGGMGDFGDDEE